MSSILLELKPEELTRYRTERDPLGEECGFMGAAELAKKAIETGKSVKEVVEEEKKVGLGHGEK